MRAACRPQDVNEMFDTILENHSKAVESTLRLQQEMLRNWTMQCPVRDAEVV